MEYDKKFQSSFYGPPSAAGLTAYETALQAPPQRETVNSALERCGVLLNELAHIEGRLSSLAGRVDGPVPDNAAEAKTLSPAPCLVGGASYVAASLDRIVSKLNSQITRIENALG